MLYPAGTPIYGFGINPITGVVANNEEKEGQRIQAGSIVQDLYGELKDTSNNLVYLSGGLIGKSTGVEKTENGRVLVQIAANTSYRKNRSLLNFGGGQYLPMTINAWFDASQTTDDEADGLNYISDLVAKQKIAENNKSGQVTTSGTTPNAVTTSNPTKTGLSTTSLIGIGIGVIGAGVGGYLLLSKKSKKKS